MQRREERRGEVRRTAAIDELEQRVQVDVSFGGEPPGEPVVEAGRGQGALTPARDAVIRGAATAWRAGSCLVCVGARVVLACG
jgi:hypothetical protein